MESKINNVEVNQMVALPKKIKEDDVVFDEGKFTELMLYISKKSESDERYGATKLNKILHYSDFEAYRKLGKPITGADYKHHSEGAIPNQLVPIREKLLRNKDAEIVDNPYYGQKQKRLIAKREPKLRAFGNAELQIVNEMIERLWEDNADTVSGKSHEELGYKLTKTNEIIPYAFAYFIARKPSPAEIQLGLEVANRHGLG